MDRQQTAEFIDRHALAVTFRESRVMLPAHLAAIAMVILPISFANWRGFTLRGNDNVARALLLCGLSASLALLVWAIARVIVPVTVGSFGRSGLWLRSRRFDSGWRELWRLRRFAFGTIDRIELGTRSDYPRSWSYSDTAGYEFIVAIVTEASRGCWYSYAPLQRVKHRKVFIEMLLGHPNLRSKIRFVGSLAMNASCSSERDRFEE